MAQVCTSRAVPFVDVTAGVSTDPIWRQEVAAGDAFHPSTRGYGQLATHVAPPILQWLTELIVFEKGDGAVRRLKPNRLPTFFKIANER